MVTDPDRTCPRCGGRRRKKGECRHCGWSPDDRRARPRFRIPILEAFDEAPARDGNTFTNPKGVLITEEEEEVNHGR